MHRLGRTLILVLASSLGACTGDSDTSAPANSPPAGSPSGPESSVASQPPDPTSSSEESYGVGPPTEPPGDGPTPTPIVTREPAPGFACESSDIDGLSFLNPGWHAGTEFKWNNIGCRGRYQLAGPSLVVECTADINGWMTYGINPPTTLEPNYEPDADPDVVYRLWMTNTLWFGNASGELTGYQLPWTYTSIFAQRSLATGTFDWSHNDQWYDGNDQLVYDTFHPRFVDTRTILNAQARSFAVGYLLFWPASDHNGAGAAFETVSLRGVGYCGV